MEAASERPPDEDTPASRPRLSDVAHPPLVLAARGDAQLDPPELQQKCGGGAGSAAAAALARRAREYPDLTPWVLNHFAVQCDAMYAAATLLESVRGAPSEELRRRRGRGGRGGPGCREEGRRDDCRAVAVAVDERAAGGRADAADRGLDAEERADERAGRAVAECRGRVARLEETSLKARAELDIALKFVDWFSQRGEGYEHNMTALDRRLDGMVRSAREASAEPFSPSVRLAA